MRMFLCGFMDREAKLFQTNSVCAAGLLAADRHDAFVASGQISDLDSFMDALAAWRGCPSYPFPNLERYVAH